jgi:outer membrane lipoprotein SlyB
LFGRYLIPTMVLSLLAGCGPNYSPDTYSAAAVQQANKVEQGVVVGVRNVGVTASGTVGTVTGAAAGGIAGSQAAPSPLSAFTALGGSLVGGIAGSAVEHATADTTAFEYIVRKANGELVSVTQKDKTPLALGQKVLVIAGTQARVVPDYTVPPLTPAAATAGTPSKPEIAPAPPADTRPAEPAKADATPLNPSPAATETSPAPAATIPVAPPMSAPTAEAPRPAAPTPAVAPAAPTPVPDAKPGGTSDHGA